MLSLLTPIYISINYVTSKKDKFSVSQENVDILYVEYYKSLQSPGTHCSLVGIYIRDHP